jgi:hypothetical protein
MRKTRRRFAAVALAVAGSSAVVALVAGPATAQAPDASAWWNAANVGNGAPAPPPPPDVPAGDLLVQGSNPSSSIPTTPVSAAPPSTTAVAGLSFTLPTGATVGKLTLPLDGTVPPQVNVVACRATRSFFAEENGPWGDVPPSDCTKTVTGAVDNNALVFADIAKLVQNDTLQIVLLPGAVDRVVIKKPTEAALEVTTLGGVGASAPPFGSGTAAGPSFSGGPITQPVAPVGGGVVLPPASSGGSTLAVPPVIAPSAPAVPAQQQARTAAAASGDGLTTGQRRTLAAVVIGLELLGFLMLMGDRDAERLGGGLGSPLLAGGGAGLVGGRLRPPDRGSSASTTAARNIAGVGRFRGLRQGPPPRL